MGGFRLRLGLPLAVTLVALLGQAVGASAQTVTCRTDPVVALSNGVSVTLYETITDTATDVTKITYALHVPVGVSIKSISYVGAVPATAQSITLHQDENPGNYDAYTEVYTATPNIPVTAYMAANSTVSCQTAGHSWQLLHSHLHLS
jgi:hypothetical protein